MEMVLNEIGESKVDGEYSAMHSFKQREVGAALFIEVSKPTLFMKDSVRYSPRMRSECLCPAIRLVA
jgi:hypothetical protein